MMSRCKGSQYSCALGCLDKITLTSGEDMEFGAEFWAGTGFGLLVAILALGIGYFANGIWRQNVSHNQGGFR